MAKAEIVIAEDTEVGRQLRQSVAECQAVFVTGLPGTGKSLFVQQLTLLAELAGRSCHSLQWDKTRLAFESPSWLQRYPEIDGVTHPAIRKAVGLWVRRGIGRWLQASANDATILIVEIPIVGGRFIELARPEDDEVESLLASSRCDYLVPVPTVEVRAAVEGKRAGTIANPRHENESKDAPPSVVQAEWLAVRELFNQWNGLPADPDRDAIYDPGVYRAVFERLLRFRNTRFLSVDTLFDAQASVYERATPVTDVVASEDEVNAAYRRLQAEFPGALVEQAVDGWAEY